MAIIYSYPLRQPKRDDLLIGTITYDENAVNPVQGNPTVSFTIGSLLDLIAGQGVAQNLQQVTNIGNTTTNSIVISNSLKVAGGYYDSSNQPGTAGQLLSSTATGTQWVNVAAQGVTSVGLSMPAAFTVTNSPVTQAGVLTVAGAGTAAQYIDGTGALQTFTTYGKWVLAGDAGVQDVTTGQTASILGGTDIATVVTSPRTLTINHSAVTRSNTTATASPNPGDTVDLVSIVSSSATGHVTGVETTTVTWPANQNTTYTIDVPATTTNINLKGSDSTDDAIALVGGTNVTITRDNDSSLTFASLNTEYTAGTGLTLNTLEFDVNVNSTAGNAPESLTTTANRTYAIQLDNNSANLVVNVPWVDTDTIQTITGTGSNNTDSGILLSDSGGTVLILGAGSVTASQTGNTIFLTGTDTDTGITGVTLATADSAGAPLSESITNRELTLTSAKYIGGANVGYVPEGGTSSTYLKGDGTWAAIPTGLIFKGTWDASGGGGGSPDLTLAANKGAGFLWICDVAGTAYPNGGTNPPSTWNLGDWAVYDGTAWTRVPATNSGVTSLTTTDGTYIDLTPASPTEATGNVTVTADLSAQDGTSDTSTRFLSKDNTWDVPSYTVDTTYTIDVPVNTTSINLKGSDSSDDAIVLTGGTNVTLSRTDASTIDIAATNTTYTAGTGLTLTGTVFSADIDATQANDNTVALSAIANRFYGVQLDNNSTIADAKLVVNIPWTDTQNPNQTIAGVGSNNTNSGIILDESGGTVLILGTTGIAASQATNTVTLTGTTYGINFQPNAGASPQINPFLRLTGTGTSSGITDLEIAGTGATTVTRNSDNKITINSTAGSYSWKARDNGNVDKEVLNGEYLKFVTATGASNNTALTGTGTNIDPYVMTLTSPNTTYNNFTGADGTTAGTAGLVPAPAATDNGKFLKGDGTWATTPQGDITEIKTTAPITGAATSGIATIGIDTMGAATASTAGTKGAVPASAAGDQLKFLRADATWVVPTDTNTWVANSKLVAGYVAAPGAVASKVWKTDASGNPAWRDDATGDNTTYTIGSGNTKVITLTGSDSSTSTVTFADGNDISISGSNGTITIASTFAEADTLATVTARGATTTTKSYFNGDLEVNDTITVKRTGSNNGKISIEGNPPLLELKNYDGQTASDQLLSSIEFYGSDVSGTPAHVPGVKASIKCSTGFDDPFGTSNRNQGCLEFATYNGTDVSNSPRQVLKITPDGGFSFGNTSTAYGTSGQLLQSNGDAPPTWVNAPISGVSGSGTQYKIPVWTSGTAIGDGNITNASTGEIGINNSNPEDYNAAVAKTGMLVVGDNSGSQQQNGIAICADAAGVGWLTFRKATGSASSDLIGGLSYSFSSDLLGFRTSGTQKMFLNDIGELSIGFSTDGSRLNLKHADNDPEGGHIRLSNTRTGGDTWYVGVGDDGSTSTVTSPGSLYFNNWNGVGTNDDTALVLTNSLNIGIGTTSPSGKFHVKVGTSTPLIVSSNSYCNNVGIRTTTPTASLQVKGNISYSYVNYTNVANTYVSVISMAGYPSGLYQISIIKKTNASSYITAIIKWDNTAPGSSAGSIVNTIASNQLGVSFNGSTTLQAISALSTGTAMSANLKCLVMNEDSCS